MFRFGSLVSRSLVQSVARNAACKSSPRLALPTVKTLSLNRSYASSSNNNDSENSEVDRVQYIITKVRENPEIREKLDDFRKLMLDNGLDFKSGEKPSLMRMMGLLANKDVKKSLVDLKESLEANGITFSPTDLSAFMKVFGSEK